MKYGFLMFSSSILAAALSGSFLSTESGNSTGIKFPPTASLSCFQAACDGHPASEGRRLRKLLCAHNRRGKIGISPTAPTAFKNARLFIVFSKESSQSGSLLFPSPKGRGVRGEVPRSKLH